MPSFKEIIQKEYILTEQEKNLIKNLRSDVKEISHWRYFELLPHINNIQFDVNKAFMLPYDGHPSSFGSNIIAQAIVDGLLELHLGDELKIEKRQQTHFEQKSFSRSHSSSDNRPQ